MMVALVDKWGGHIFGQYELNLHVTNSVLLRLKHGPKVEWY